MIWTIIFIAILVASILACIWLGNSRYSYEAPHIIAMIATIISGFVLFCMLIGITIEHTFVDQKVASLQAEREALVYQMEHNLYLGDALGDFNSKIISWRYTHDNPWTSWFQGGYIFEVDPIELN